MPLSDDDAARARLAVLGCAAAPAWSPAPAAAAPADEAFPPIVSESVAERLRFLGAALASSAGACGAVPFEDSLAGACAGACAVACAVAGVGATEVGTDAGAELAAEAAAAGAAAAALAGGDAAVVTLVADTCAIPAAAARAAAIMAALWVCLSYGLMTPARTPTPVVWSPSRKMKETPSGSSKRRRRVSWVGHGPCVHRLWLWPSRWAHRMTNVQHVRHRTPSFTVPPSSRSSGILYLQCVRPQPPMQGAVLVEDGYLINGTWRGGWATGGAVTAIDDRALPAGGPLVAADPGGEDDPSDGRAALGATGMTGSTAGAP